MSVPPYYPGRNIQNDDYSGISISSMVLPPAVPFGGIDATGIAHQHLYPYVFPPPPPYSEVPITRNTRPVPNRGGYTGWFLVVFLHSFKLVSVHSYPRRLKPMPVRGQKICNVRDLSLIAVILIFGAISTLILIEISKNVKARYP